MAVTGATAGTTVLSSGGRMRPRGQSTCYIPICMGSIAVAFKLDFASSNSSQNLFGVETAYLRNGLGDSTRMREYAMHRMLAKFGLPHARTRHVRFFVNNEQIGFYTFMEALDQDYIQARSFGKLFDLDNYALYKVKTMALGCWSSMEYSKMRFNLNGFDDKCTSPDESQKGTDCCADKSWGEEKTCATGYTVEPLVEPCRYTCLSDTGAKPERNGPYAYERGFHRNKVPVHYNYEKCGGSFFGRVMDERRSVVRAFYDRGFSTSADCGEFLTSQGLVDRDLGQKKWDAPMHSFINEHIGTSNACTFRSCTNKEGLRDIIDKDNWLKNFAVYAVAGIEDSPMGNTNNWYVAAMSDGDAKNPKWKIVQYDHNNDPRTIKGTLCDPSCYVKDATRFSVARPTCKAMHLNNVVGPILTDNALYDRYIQFVGNFTSSVYTDKTLLAHLETHTAAIKSAVNTSPDKKLWGEIDTSELLDWMKTRGERVTEQVDMLRTGKFPYAAGKSAQDACVTVDNYYTDVNVARGERISVQFFGALASLALCSILFHFQ